MADLLGGVPEEQKRFFAIKLLEKDDKIDRVVTNRILALPIFAAGMFLEACGYMARVAFVMDRIFHKFGLSGKSFIPCGAKMHPKENKNVCR